MPTEISERSLAQRSPEMLATLAALSEVEIVHWTCREVLIWFVEHNWLNLLDDFKDVSGAHLLSLPVINFLTSRKVEDFPLPIACDGSAHAKINQLCALAHELSRLQREMTRGASTSSQEPPSSASSGNTERIAIGLSKWGETVNIFQTCHRQKHLYYGGWASFFTVVVVALNALISGAIFSSISGCDEHSLHESPIRIAAGVLSLSAGILSAVRSAMRLETVSEQHASAARRFAKLYVRYNDMSEMLNIDYTVGKAKKAAEWQDWFKDYLDVMEQAPMIKDELYETVRDRIAQRKEKEAPSAQVKFAWKPSWDALGLGGARSAGAERAGSDSGDEERGGS